MQMYEADQMDKKRIEDAKKRIEVLKGRPAQEEIKERLGYDLNPDGVLHTYTRDNAKEIKEQERIIAQAEQNIADRQKMRAAKHLEEMTTSRNREEEQREQREKYIKDELERIKQNEESERSTREYYLRDLKKRYKSGSKFDRFLNLLHRKKPNWKKISQLSTKELEFLVNYGAGNTMQQYEKEERIKQINDKKKRKAQYRQRWVSFTRSLNSKTTLKQKMELEEGYEKDSLYSGYHR